VATYALAVAALVVVPLLVQRALRGQPARAASADRAVRPDGAARTAWVRGLRIGAAIVLAAVLAVCVHQPVVASLNRATIDSHELVHLGSLLRIEQGYRPYVEAETQYGPGSQVLTHRVMRWTGFTIHGFRASQLIFNFAAAIAFYSICLVTLRWYVSLLTVLVSLWVSPFLLFDHFGWGVVFRWMSPFVIGLLLSWFVGAHLRPAAFHGAMFGLGVAWGFFSWLASENLASGLLTTVLVVGLCWAFGEVDVRSALRWSLTLLTGWAVMWAALFATIHDVGTLGTFISLYLRPGTHVAAGFSNTPWSQGTGNPWYLPYVVTPYLYLVLGGALVVTARRAARDEAERVDRLTFIGLWAASVALYLPTMLRADSSHFLSGTLALGALLAFAVTRFPSLVSSRPSVREAWRVGLVIACLAVYPGPTSASEAWARAWRPVAHAGAAIEASVGWIRDVRKPRPATTDRLGFQPGTERCCSENTWTWQQWWTVMDDIAAVTAGRPTLVHQLFGTVAGAVYFLADLRPATAITEPLMSIWTDADLVRWTAQIDRSAVACVVSTSPQAKIVAHVVARLGRVTMHERTSPIRYVIYCRNDDRA
jgi:hypothetical protein